MEVKSRQIIENEIDAIFHNGFVSDKCVDLYLLQKNENSPALDCFVVDILFFHRCRSLHVEKSKFFNRYIM